MRTTEDLNLTHAFLNVLHSGYRGKCAALDTLARLELHEQDGEDLAYFTKILRVVDAWLDELWRGRAIIRKGDHDSLPGEGVSTLELFQRLRKELMADAVKIKRILSSSEMFHKIENIHFLIAAFAGFSYSRRDFVEGLISYGENFERPDIAERWRQYLPMCEEDITLLTMFVSRCGRRDTIGSAFVENVREATLNLPGVIRSQIHDMDITSSRYSGELTFQQVGFDDMETSLWERAGFDVKTAGYWRAFDFSADEASVWIEKGFPDPEIAGTWRNFGFSLEEASRWSRDGFLPHAASDWKQAGYTASFSSEEQTSEVFSAADLRHWIKQWVERPSSVIKRKK